MIKTAVEFYTLVIIVDGIMGYVPQYRHHEWGKKMRRAVDFVLNPLRRVLPKEMPFDFSPLIAVIIFSLIIRFL